MLSIHNKLSAGAQNVIGTYVHNNYACLLVLVNAGKAASCVIAINARKNSKSYLSKAIFCTHENIMPL